MNELMLLATPLFLLFLGMAAFLPVLCLTDNLLAIKSNRVIFKKSTDQISILSILSWLLLAHALLIDYFANGFIFKFVSQNTITQTLYFYCIIGAFATLINVLMMKNFRNTGIYILASFISIVTASGLFALSWIFLRDIDLMTITSMKDILLIPSHGMKSAEQLTFVFYMITSLVMGLVVAQSMVLCWYLIRRNKDDYGRDYYVQIINMRSRQLIYSGSLLLVSAAFFMWRIPALSLERFILSLTETSILLIISTFSFALPLAVIFWFILAKNPQPLQKKSLFFLSFLFLVLGYIALVTRIWI